MHVVLFVRTNSNPLALLKYNIADAHAIMHDSLRGYVAILFKHVAHMAVVVLQPTFKQLSQPAHVLSMHIKYMSCWLTHNNTISVCLFAFAQCVHVGFV